ncbi:hypothetical protein DFAR_200030 [Desulfarculales bacterium]
MPWTILDFFKLSVTIAEAPQTIKLIWLLVVNVEFYEIPQWCGDEIDYGHEGEDITVASGSCPSGLEDAVKPLQAGAEMVGGSAT